MNNIKRLTAASKPIIWTGDLNDDCTAIWAGLMLRAEWMDEEYWWWEVTDMENPTAKIGSSNNEDTPCIGGQMARQKAEEAARKYLGIIH
ncbi:MAG: hypothetical protein HY062_12530 [Bacteroidetes bacterium]|nr:hypothetical protein [Bacteroidota bacterium]